MQGHHLLRTLGVVVASTVSFTVGNPSQLAAQPTSPGTSVVWADQFGESTELYSAVAAAESAVYVAGNDVGAQNPVYLHRYTGDGSLEWSLTLPYTATPYAPVVAADDEQVCVGGVTVRDFDDPGHFFFQSTGFARCFSHDGSTRGTGYVETENYSGGYPPFTRVTAILLSPDAVYVVGTTEGTLKGDCLDGPCTAGASQDAFIRKYDVSSGGALSTAWTRQVDMAGWDNFLGAAFDSLGNVRVWGYRVRFAETPGVILRCYGPNGDACGSSDLPPRAEAPFAGTFTADAFYVGALSYESFASVVHRYSVSDAMAAGPDPDWSASIAKSFVYGLAPDDRGVLVVGSVTPGQGPYDGSDVLLRRYDAAGAMSWGVRFGSDANDNAFSVATDGARVYVTGQTGGSLVPGAVVSLGADAFVARVARPEENIRDLIDGIEALQASGVLKPGQAHALTVKLEHALAALEDGDTAELVARLEAFINQVNAFMNARILGTDDGSALIDGAQQVIAQVTG